MIERLARNMAHFYIKKGIIKDDEDKYIYGFELLLSTLCNVALIIVTAILMNVFIESVLYLFSFVLLRSLGGGYHAKTHVGCIWAFTILFFAFVLLLEHLPSNIVTLYILICVVVSALIIWNNAPVESPNKPLSSMKKTRLKSLCLLAICSYMVLAILICSLPIIPGSIICFTYSGVLAASVSMMTAAKI